MVRSALFPGVPRSKHLMSWKSMSWSMLRNCGTRSLTGDAGDTHRATCAGHPKGHPLPLPSSVFQTSTCFNTVFDAQGIVCIKFKLSSEAEECIRVLELRPSLNMKMVSKPPGCIALVPVHKRLAVRLRAVKIIVTQHCVFAVQRHRYVPQSCT